MSRDPLKDGWRYYGCARWGCDAVNPDFQSYGAEGRSWCLHHRPGPTMRFIMRWTVFRAPPRLASTVEPMLPLAIVRRHFVAKGDVQRGQENAPA